MEIRNQKKNKGGPRALAVDYDPQLEGRTIKAHQTAFNHKLLSASAAYDISEERANSVTGAT